MSIVSSLRKLLGVSLAFIDTMQEQADARRGKPDRPYEGPTLFEQTFGVTPADMREVNAARRRRIGNCFSQRRADAAAKAGA